MSVSRTGRNLVFIISQPRAGSTLLQKVLANHPMVKAPVEPWLLLSLVSILKPDEGNLDWVEQNSNRNSSNFLNAVAGGRDNFLEGVRALVSGVYSGAMHGNDGLFVDKTPRYYRIIPELSTLFPDARFLLLFRNPLSVLASVHTTWASLPGLLNSDARDDLLKAPDLLLEGKEILGDRARCIHYEELVSQPEVEVAEICEWLNIPYESSMITYGGESSGKLSLGDPVSVYQHERPVVTKIDKWLDYIQAAQNWRFADSYARYLGPDRMNRLGYPYAVLTAELASRRPPFYSRLFTLPFLFSMRVHLILRGVYRAIIRRRAGS